MADAIAGVLDCDRIAEAGAAFNQQAARMSGGGIVAAAPRFIEYGARATVLLVPGLFRVDLQPMQETLGLHVRALGPDPVRWEADPEAWDTYRRDSSEPMQFRGSVDFAGQPLGIEVRAIMITDTEAGGIYLSARAAIVPR